MAADEKWTRSAEDKRLTEREFNRRSGYSMAEWIQLAEDLRRCGFSMAELRYAVTNWSICSPTGASDGGPAGADGIPPQLVQAVSLSNRGSDIAEDGHPVGSSQTNKRALKH